MLKIKRFVFNPFQENTYLVDAGDGKCIIVDPGAYDPQEKVALLSELRGKEPVAVLLTHGHPDHIAAAGLLQREFGVEVYMHPADAEVPAHIAGPLAAHLDLNFRTTPVSDGQSLTLAGLECEVIHTPGHSPGGVCYLFKNENVLFSGDTLFRGTIGRSDLYKGEYDDLIRSVMDRIMGLPGCTEVLPGHAGSTTIAEERTENPFLQPFNEPEEDCAVNSL
ncbi:MAG: MBL fold metallo-hydrolase [Candidatus Cryptobacteroides sp.]